MLRNLGRWVPHVSKQYDMDMALSLLTLKRRK
ncbi:unnamed protein product, partial [Haemonchus placei]|uniref:Integrase n=1 Tax=Haemonchus placei TaxID=6290 RepID=A0A0N4WMI2_HAEPC